MGSIGVWNSISPLLGGVGLHPWRVIPGRHFLQHHPGLGAVVFISLVPRPPPWTSVQSMITSQAITASVRRALQ
ncbi:hypothetical protein FQN60_007702 [Etheostoma spectabile]|uniref:Uncharacterized protein n=1 Tax=Etheostoma spectabile TaxID=54343 RepID=A0A5J5CZ15_9PERO|nr:hypothetical protein FQN60_007702 [Etheostoma spectabile]